MIPVNYTSSNLTGIPPHNNAATNLLSIYYIINRFMLPILGSFGVIGNTINLTVFARRSRNPSLFDTERIAVLAFVALAVSDLCFSASLVPLFWYYEQRVLFSCRSFALYYQLYRNFVSDLFIKVSTWLATIVSFSRFMCVCHPAHSTIFKSLRHFKVVIVSTFFIWFVLLSPRLFIYNVQTHDMGPSKTVFIISLGKEYRKI